MESLKVKTKLLRLHPVALLKTMSRYVAHQVRSLKTMVVHVVLSLQKVHPAAIPLPTGIPLENIIDGSLNLTLERLDHLWHKNAKR